MVNPPGCRTFSAAVEQGAYESGRVFRNWDRMFSLATAVVVVRICVCRLYVNDDFFASVSELCTCCIRGVAVNIFCYKSTIVTMLVKCTNSFLGCIFG